MWTEIMQMRKYEIERKLKAEGYLNDPEQNPFVEKGGKRKW